FPLCRASPAAVYTLPLPDALPVCKRGRGGVAATGGAGGFGVVHNRSVIDVVFTEGRDDRDGHGCIESDRAEVTADHKVVVGTGADGKSTRLNSSHVKTSYAAFCLE